MALPPLLASIYGRARSPTLRLPAFQWSPLLLWIAPATWLLPVLLTARLIWAEAPLPPPGEPIFSSPKLPAAGLTFGHGTLEESMTTRPLEWRWIPQVMFTSSDNFLAPWILGLER